MGNREFQPLQQTIDGSTQFTSWLLKWLKSPNPESYRLREKSEKRYAQQVRLDSFETPRRLMITYVFSIALLKLSEGTHLEDWFGENSGFGEGCIIDHESLGGYM